MAERVILHCDLNNFFASVSLLFNPTLKNLPVAVCGDEEARHGIILAKNEIAKKLGIKTAETIFEAKKKCPDLVLLPSMMDKYVEHSKKVIEIYSRYTDMIEPFGIDECWLDVTGSSLIYGDGEHIANLIRKDVKKELGITISVGVSFNKVFAKLGSDLKKPDAVTVITKDNFKEKIWHLPVSDLLFAGKKTSEKLNLCGIYTISDVASCPDATLKRLLGKNGLLLKRYACGEDNSPVITPTDSDKPKSIGKTITRKNDFCNYEAVWTVFLSLAQTISDALRRHNMFAGGVQIHLRTSSLATKEISRTFSDTTDSAYIIAKRGMDLFRESYFFSEPLRSVGIRVINLKDINTAVQEDIFGLSDENQKQEKIDDSLYMLRNKFGKKGVMRGSTIKEEN